MWGIEADEQRSMGPQPPCALRVRGGAGPSASLPRLGDVPHRVRRGASHTAPRRRERDPCHYADTLPKPPCAGSTDLLHLTRKGITINS